MTTEQSLKLALPASEKNHIYQIWRDLNIIDLYHYYIDGNAYNNTFKMEGETAVLLD